ncbi:tetratricopeptide repeat protein [Cytophagaceae bacterium DM2B3-1]|uniref:Tetratricopeptide repeat protein n=1 Tax=Xanthocytophaga flava TaxID=3048013 RepID=A0ABT7CRR3_9BACT|nr:tetratricopeptide repeat protein [Xanthocytophaga flavus]MDJ1496418.1 tetratricopeptide repeat protein [Xanthocytophaga flavus]
MFFRKSFYLIFLLTLFFYKGFGQTALLDKTAEYLKQNNLQSAKETIEQASQNEATKNDARTWYLKGFVYKELYKQNPVAGEIREIAVQSLSKSITLDLKKTYTSSSETALEYLYGTYYNEGIDLLNAKQFEKALKDLKIFIDYRAKTKPDEFYAEALYHAGFISFSLSKKVDAQQYYEQALQKGYKSPLLYDDLAQIYLGTANKTKAVEVITAGRKAFPDDPNLRTSEINLYLQLKEYAKAEKLIEDYLKANPNDTDAMMVAGSVYETIAKKDTTKEEAYFQKRLSIYKKILGKEPNNFLANYNLGIAFYNHAVDLINKPDVYQETITQFNQRIEVISSLIVESRPYIEKASQLSPQNINSLKALSGIYHYLNDRDRFQQVQNKIKLLENKN